MNNKQYNCILAEKVALVLFSGHLLDWNYFMFFLIVKWKLENYRHILQFALTIIIIFHPVWSDDFCSWLLKEIRKGTIKERGILKLNDNSDIFMANSTQNSKSMSWKGHQLCLYSIHYDKLGYIKIINLRLNIYCTIKFITKLRISFKRCSKKLVTICTSWKELDYYCPKTKNALYVSVV